MRPPVTRSRPVTDCARCHAANHGIRRRTTEGRCAETAVISGSPPPGMMDTAAVTRRSRFGNCDAIPSIDPSSHELVLNRYRRR